MGLNPMRAGGSLAYALAQRGLLTTDDVYGPSTASMPLAGMVAGASGAYSSNSAMGTRVSSAPPSLRSTANPPSGSSIPVLGPVINAIPGGSLVHILAWVAIAYLVIRFVVKETG